MKKFLLLLLTVLSIPLFAAPSTDTRWRFRVNNPKAQATDGIALFVSVGQPLIGPTTNGMLFGDYTVSNSITHVVATNPAGYSVGWSQSTHPSQTTDGATSTILSPNARNTEVSGYSTNGTFSYLFGVTNDTTGAFNNRAIVQLTILAPFTPDPPIVPPVITNALPPFVYILAPTNGAILTSGFSLDAIADAQDRQGPVETVGWSLLKHETGSIVTASTSGAPWAFPLSVGVGTYQLTATAFNLAGLFASTNVSFSVVPPAVVSPVVFLTVPTNGLTLTAPGAFSLAATATDADGTIQSVQFYQSFNGAAATLIGSDPASPYNLAVSGLVAGSYGYSVAATDNGGNRVVSSNVVVIVNAAVVPVSANAGPDQSIQSGATAQLAGTATGSGITSTTWTQNAGPGTASFSSTSVLNPTVTFTAVAAGQPAATYSLRLTVVGTSGTAIDDVVISVSGPPAVGSTAAKGFQLPVWVNFPNRSVESVQFVLTNNFNPTLILTQQLTVHGLNYDGKMGLQLNNSNVLAVKNSTVLVHGNALGWGGVGGDFHTITISAPVPANTLRVGTNTVAFWWFDTNAFNAFFQHEPFGFQVLDYNIKNAANSVLIPTNTFTYEDPTTWTPPLPTAAHIAAGEQIFTNRNLLKTSLGAPMIASCADCHMRDGRDLQYFGYHNKSIIARAKTHGLSQLQAEQLASYVRSSAAPIYGRPWNSPYQPGPGLDSGPLKKWAAGAGLSAVAPTDNDILTDIFPGGVITNTAIGLHGRLSPREVRSEMQLPDWNHWLPQIHPLDAFGSNLVGRTKLLAWYDGGHGYTPADVPYVLRRVLKKGTPAVVAQSVANTSTFWAAWDSQHAILRGLTGIPDQSPSESDSQKIYSIALLQMVKTAELMMEFEIEEIVPQQLLKPSPDPRMWRSALGFSTSPNILHLNLNHSGIAQNTPRDHYYFTMAWYQTQLALNGGSRCYIGPDYQHGQRPMDWGYMHNFLQSWPTYTGRGNAYMFMNYFTKGLQSMDNGRGPERWGKAGWNPHAQYGIFWLFSQEKRCFNNVSTTVRRQLIEAHLRNWIAGNKLYPASSYYLNLDGPTLHPQARADWIPPRQNADGSDYLANGIWNCFGTGTETMNGMGIDKTLQNEIITWSKTVWPLADWESRRPPP